MATKIITITTRARALGYGSTSKPLAGVDFAAIEPVTEPDVQGGLATCEREWAYDRKIYSGGVWWNCALFYKGQRVVDRPSMVLRELREYGTSTVEVEVAE